MKITADSWQREYTQAIKNPAELLDLLGLEHHWLQAAQQAGQSFPLKVPRSFIARMRYGDPADPLLQQVLPVNAELRLLQGYTADPLDEKTSNIHKGILHKYQGRVLLLLASHCVVNCRYCFRRHFPYQDNHLSRQQWLETINYIRRDASIEEIIYSGGDPLAVNDQKLSLITTELSALPHLKRLRIHSRLPIMIPRRITPELIDILTPKNLQTVMVIHCNHPNEIDSSVREALYKLSEARITLLNQSVLLKGVNDNLEVLKTLSETLFSAGVLPYYLHLLDKVSGAAHFEVSDNVAQKLVGQMMNCMPGYLVPKLVREVAGETTKVPLLPLWK